MRTGINPVDEFPFDASSDLFSTCVGTAGSSLVGIGNRGVHVTLRALGLQRTAVFGVAAHDLPLLAQKVALAQLQVLLGVDVLGDGRAVVVGGAVARRDGQPLQVDLALGPRVGRHLALALARHCQRGPGALANRTPAVAALSHGTVAALGCHRALACW